MLGLDDLLVAAGAGLTGLITDVIKKKGGKLLEKIDIDLAQPNIKQAAKKYIQAYWKRHGQIKILPGLMKEPMPLDSLYTAVKCLREWDIQRFASIEALEQSYRQSTKRSFQSEQPERQEGTEVARAEQYLMVLGGPGVGKSTFLRKLGLEALKGKQGELQRLCLPVLIELKEFKDDAIDLNQVIARELTTCGFPEAEQLTASLLKQGKLLVLLDGLDEVPAGNTNAVIRQIEDFVDRNDQNYFVASCRTAAYRSSFRRFTDVEMAEFDDEQIEQFIQRWFHSDLDRREGTAQRCWELLQRPENASAKELAQTPLLLTFICLVYDRSQSLPSNRSTLYSKALNILLEDWAAEKRLERDPIYQGLNTELKKALLAEIAYQGFVDDQLFFQRQQLVDRIKAFLADTVDNPKYLDGKKVLDAIAVQQGILVERAEDIFSFSHLTLQEYLTAYHINEDYELLEHLVDNHLTDERWREVFLMVAGLPTRADKQLSLMDTATRSFINTPKLQTLLNWAEQVTAGSQGNYTPVSKLAVAIYFAISFARALASTRALGNALAFASALTLALTLASVLAIARDLARDRDRDLASAHDLALARARDLAREKYKIFKGGILSALIEGLEALQSEIPNDRQSQEIWLAFANRLEQTYLDTFQLKREWLELSEEDANAIADYLYACELMIRCKESAVRVSRETWAGIEGQILRPSE